MHFEHEVHLPIVYEGIQLATAHRVDYIIEKCLIVEIKCVERVLAVHRAQPVVVSEAGARLPLGLLLTFNVPRMKDGIQRVINAPEQDL